MHRRLLTAIAGFWIGCAPCGAEDAECFTDYCSEKTQNACAEDPHCEPDLGQVIAAGDDCWTVRFATCTWVDEADSDAYFAGLDEDGACWVFSTWGDRGVATQQDDSCTSQAVERLEECG